jgi:polar amino acid transport system permease protein
MPGFDLQLLLHGQYHDWLLAGLLVALKLGVLTIACALPLAIVIALLRLSPWRPLQWLGATYVEVIRNVPLIAHLLFWYFGAPELLPDAVKERLYAGSYEFVAAAIGLTLYGAAFMAENIRSGIRAIPAVQFEAARALGLGFLPAMRHVVLPQALRVTVPPLLSQAVIMWNDTSIATVIGVGEIMYQAARVESSAFRSPEAFGFASACYPAGSLALTAVAAWIHRRWPVRTL